MFVFLLFFLLVHPSQILGIQSINCTDNSCQYESPDPIFYIQNIVPGQKFFSNLVVNNNRSNDCTILTYSSIDKSNSLNEYLFINIQDSYKSLFSGSLLDLSNNTIPLLTLAPSQSANLQYSIQLTANVNNSFQSSFNNFDLNFNIKCQKELVMIKINEIMPNPSSGNEWIEIFNPSNSSTSLAGFSIRKSTGPTIKYLPEVTIPPYSFYMADLQTNTYLPNSGAIVYLYNQSDLVDTAKPYSSSTLKGQSWSHQYDSWWCNTNPSPNQPNETCFNSSAKVLGASTDSSNTRKLSLKLVFLVILYILYRLAKIHHGQHDSSKLQKQTF